jgi:hypothetical protein
VRTNGLTEGQHGPLFVEMCFSDDGSQLAVACYNHHTIQVWDLRAIRARLKEMKLDWD